MGRGILCPFALYKSYKAFILRKLKLCYDKRRENSKRKNRKAE